MGKGIYGKGMKLFFLGKQLLSGCWKATSSCSKVFFTFATRANQQYASPPDVVASKV